MGLISNLRSITYCGWVILDKSLNLSEPQLLPHLNEDNHNYLVALLRIKTDKVHVKYFAQSQVHNRNSVSKC